MTTATAIAKATNALLAAKAKTATLYVSEKQTVRISRRMFGTPGRRKFSPRTVDLVVTVGRPNHQAREFIRRARQAGEPFPVKRVQLQFPSR